MTTVQSGYGRIRVFEDFLGPEWTIAETADDSMNIGAFRIVGQGKEQTDSGVIVNESDPCLNGVARLTTTDEDVHSIGLTTALCLDVAKMAPLVLECRLQLSDLDTKQVFFGVSSVNGDTATLEDHIVNIDTGAATTITLTATSLCGFLLSSEATDHEDWHAVYNGGTTTGETTSTNVDLNDDAVAAEWQVLRLEIDPDATARWYIDGVLLKTLEGALSTTTDVAAQLILENLANTSDQELADVDYILIEANRDWTV